MAIDEIFSKLIQHMMTGLLFHNHLCHLYGFLNLLGYQQQQKHQYFQQAKSCFDIQNFYLSYYNKMILPLNIQPQNVIPNNWFKYTKSDVDTNTKRSAIKQAFSAWQKWEKNTQQLLNNCYQQLYNLKQFYACQKILFLIQQVGEELQQLKTEQINLESANYDMVYILDLQKQLLEKYLGSDKQ